MKGPQVLVFLGILGVSLGRAYDDKSDAIRQIEEKYREAENLKVTILKTIQNELKVTNSAAGEGDLIKQLQQRINNTNTQFEVDADATIRTAIVQGKPIAVIDCIRDVTYHATIVIANCTTSNTNNIMAIKAKKIQKIGFDDYAVNAIIKGLKELKDQSIQKIQKNEGALAALKKEAIDRCDSAISLLGDIEIRVTEPVLSTEYIKMRQQIDREVKQLKTKLGEELNGCLGKPKENNTS